MITGLDKLVRLQKPQVKPAGEMSARAFQDYPLYNYLMPDASERRNRLHYLLEFLIRYGVLYGEAYATSPGLEGVAVWLPPEKSRMTLWRAIRSGGFSIIFKLGMKFISRQWGINDYMSSVHEHRAPFPHWYLFVLAVDPVLQGKGYAGNLLRAMLARIDEEHLPCYVETEREENVSMYQHYGFKVVEEGIIPGTEIGLWAMLRESSG